MRRPGAGVDWAFDATTNALRRLGTVLDDARPAVARVAAWSHFPRDAWWQLLATPLTHGDFLRQPFVRPGVAVYGLELVSPHRVAVDASDLLPVMLENPRRHWLIISYRDASGRTRDCATSNERRVNVRCRVPSTGELAVLANRSRSGFYEHVVSVAVTRR